ncbi:MAG: 50S ribosomal protein L35 [Candidatus Dadabacteria bacterium]|nr:MAG: 50S ribosomal protein L35 [Candidatus Dadabacteria bacterium]
MPKMKTKRGAAKRFRLTARGKIRRRRAYLRHILATKNRKRKRTLGQPTLVSAADRRQVRRMLPYG